MKMMMKTMMNKLVRKLELNCFQNNVKMRFIFLAFEYFQNMYRNVYRSNTYEVMYCFVNLSAVLVS